MSNRRPTAPAVYAQRPMALSTREHFEIAMPRRCAIERCTRYAKVDQLCLLHGRLQSIRRQARTHVASSPMSITISWDMLHQVQPSRMCRAPGCTSYARRRGRCSRHGGAKPCAVHECQTPAQTGGHCRAHGGGKHCKAVGCDAFARYQGCCSRHATPREPSYPTL
ncbi:hypothetical protein SDRG_06119 [Saprolegnia diclina VS20]|uniref:WRKY19-like zinc finger domain-containing protein n=1 Tax=Saprolegnia diclina (strain VS20) TaxID=1156394 RepID=T0QFG4_SAPDV|nr:hypothetical protein SDRG_06119 [Saprolegnia diclina VS20]EQC36684.1 hypothetical protein SDRG_06119 [Saprolegnia diclina VS20]|eukprot:XP_008610105.1 hypothetical protein SDRG_06119 [Saprolegnia diclina VS20]